VGQVRKFACFLFCGLLSLGQLGSAAQASDSSKKMVSEALPAIVSWLILQDQGGGFWQVRRLPNGPGLDSTAFNFNTKAGVILPSVP
jgi:hypothetical protein